MRDIAHEPEGWQADQSWRNDDRFREEREPEPKKPAGPLVVFYGDSEPEPPPYLVAQVLPQGQTAILAGQWSAGKTFLAIDLALAVMLGLDFAGHKVERQGAVIWLAAEGASEVDARLKGAALHRTGEDHKGRLPFCRQVGGVPILTDPASFDALLAIVAEAKTGLAERHGGLPLALIVIDTLNSAAGFADQNDGAEAQRVMALGRRLSDATGALVLFIDHFGKVAETGVKGSSDKGNASDAILSALADKDGTGAVDNRRMSIFKLRSGPTGETVPFKLVQVAINEWGKTTCAVEWAKPTISECAVARAQPKPDWTGAGRTFRSAMTQAMLDHGREQRPFGLETKPVKAVELRHVRAEFTKRYAAETADAKRKQFKREMTNGASKGLIASREIEGADWFWFCRDGDSQANPDTRADTDTPL